MKKFIYTLLILCLGVLTSQAQETLVSSGRNRNIIVYAPNGIPANRPLLISLHGMNQSAAYQKGQADYAAVADTAKFVVVYPDGEGGGWDLGGDKDIKFITDIIDAMANRYKIDRNRVYLSGFSMGGMMTYYAMTKIADKIAAFAPVSGYNMGGPNATSSRPIPILHVHGTGDDVCTYGPVQSHIDAWVKRNKCNTTPQVSKPLSGPANTNAEMRRYRNGENGVEVAHLVLPGKGHWHSNDPAVAMTNVEVWNFCKRWSLSGATNEQNTSNTTLDTATHEYGNASFDQSTGKYFFYTPSYSAIEFNKFNGKKVADYASLVIKCGSSSTIGYRLDIRIKKSNGEYFTESIDGMETSTHYLIGDANKGTRYEDAQFSRSYDLKTILKDYLSIDPNCTFETIRLNTVVPWGADDENRTGKYFFTIDEMSLLTEIESLIAKDGINLYDLQMYNYDNGAKTLIDADKQKLDGTTSYEAGTEIYGKNATVYYLTYTDLSEYNNMYIAGEGGLRIMLNRKVDNGSTQDGNLIEINPTFNNGYAIIDLSKYEYAHLHSIKVAWGASAKLNAIKLYNKKNITIIEPENPTQPEEEQTPKNLIYIDPANASAGSYHTISVKMKNDINVTGYQFDVYLPEGMSFAQDFDGNYAAALSSQRTSTSATDLFMSSIQKDGSLRIICNSSTGSAFSGNDGEIATIRIFINKSVAAGTYGINIKNVEMSEKTGNNGIKPDNSKAQITVAKSQSSTILGDANNDGEISVSDYSAIAYHIVHGSNTINTSVADINGDGIISVADLAAISYLIMNGSIKK